MTTTANIDYINSVFEFPTLTKIIGKPTYESLTTIKNQLKANAGKVQCELGGGAHGHLGLILSDAEYALVSPTPYIRPIHPGPNVPVGVTQVENTNLRAQYNESLRLFRETNAVEEALITQLSNALPAHYLKRYRNTISNKIQTPIHKILSDLFTAHGAITDHELITRESTLRARIFEISQPLVELYNAVEELQEVATASQNPYTDSQLVQIGMQLLRNMNDYEKARGEWMSLPHNSKTWVNFKTHFDDAYQYLLNLRGQTMKDTAFQQQANFITHSILDTIAQKREADKAEIFKVVNDAKSTILRAMSAVPSLQSEQEDVESDLTPPTLPSANASMNDKVQLKMLEILERIDKKLNDNNKQPPKKRPRGRRVLDFYCWSHGAGNHKSCDCRNKKFGHKNDATFENKMGGSNAYCKVAGKSE